MACFLVSAAEAIAVTVAAKIVKNREMSAESLKLQKKAAAATRQEKKLPWSRKLMILARLLWGGAFLLCYEHIWHGEIVPWFPFLTAMSDPADTSAMLTEMAEIGIPMLLALVAGWAVMVFIANRITYSVPASDANAE